MIRVSQICKKKRFKSFLPLLLVATGLFLSGFILNHFTQSESFADQAQLSNADCVKCHAAVAGTVDSKGSKHKTAVGCMDCHKGHPPMVSKDRIIPVCSMCHTGKAHYEIGGCNTCHSDPHAPLQMQLAANLTAPCLSCHDKQGKELKDHPSLHTKLFCTTCHKAHREVPECLKCHQPHSADMVNKDCKVCHPAHQPRTITYGADMPSKQCAGCHKGIYDTLYGTDTKHSKQTCVFCHKDKHGVVPACETCHGTPHPAGMLKQFPKCNMCHISAHSLGKEAKK
jgi:predicted CXXCH cytochrome family protein